VTAQPFERPVVIDGLWGLGHALHLVSAVGLMIDPRDLGVTLGDKSDPDAPPAKGARVGPGFDPTIFLYDRIAGGIGLAPRLFEARDVLLKRARGLVEGCSCDEGCPACVGPIASTEAASGSGRWRKTIALAILDALEA